MNGGSPVGKCEVIFSNVNGADLSQIHAIPHSRDPAKITQRKAVRIRVLAQGALVKRPAGRCQWGRTISHIAVFTSERGDHRSCQTYGCPGSPTEKRSVLGVCF
jgi:hypothetical protein